MAVLQLPEDLWEGPWECHPLCVPLEGGQGQGVTVTVLEGPCLREPLPTLSHVLHT